MTRIAIITDLHLRIGEKFNEIDTVQNFHNVISDIRKWEVDHIIVTGDISAREPRKEDCDLLKTTLDNEKVPYDIIVGNHDDSEIMRGVFYPDYIFKGSEKELYYKKRIGERTFIFLDSKKGSVSESQLLWLEKTLVECDDLPFIFIHYPPLSTRIPFMEKYHFFKDEESIQKILRKFDFPIHIFSGHHHVEKLVQEDNLTLHVTPSCIQQLDQQSLEFKNDHFIPGYRIVDYDSFSVRSTVRYLFPD